MTGFWSLAKRGIDGVYHAVARMDGRSSRRYCFGRRDGDGVAAFFRFLKKSPRFGMGISAPFGVFCFLSIG